MVRKMPNIEMLKSVLQKKNNHGRLGGILYKLLIISVKFTSDWWEIKLYKTVDKVIFFHSYPRAIGWNLYGRLGGKSLKIHGRLGGETINNNN